jgi:hypothetical protein
MRSVALPFELQLGFGSVAVCITAQLFVVVCYVNIALPIGVASYLLVL